MKSDEQFLAEIKAKRDKAIKKRARTVKTVTGISSAVVLCAVMCFAVVPAVMSNKFSADEAMPQAEDIAREPESKPEDDKNTGSYYVKGDIENPDKLYTDNFNDGSFDVDDAPEGTSGYVPEGENGKKSEPRSSVLCGYKVELPSGYYIGDDGMSVYTESGLPVIRESENGAYELGGFRFDVTKKAYEKIADKIFASAKK